MLAALHYMQNKCIYSCDINKYLRMGLFKVSNITFLWINYFPYQSTRVVHDYIITVKETTQNCELWHQSEMFLCLDGSWLTDNISLEILLSPGHGSKHLLFSFLEKDLEIVDSSSHWFAVVAYFGIETWIFN